MQIEIGQNLSVLLMAVVTAATTVAVMWILFARRHDGDDDE